MRKPARNCGRQGAAVRFPAEGTACGVGRPSKSGQEERVRRATGKSEDGLEEDSYR